LACADVQVYVVICYFLPCASNISTLVENGIKTSHSDMVFIYHVFSSIDSVSL
jgi:hypothetical protein